MTNASRELVPSRRQPASLWAPRRRWPASPTPITFPRSMESARAVRADLFDPASLAALGSNRDHRPVDRRRIHVRAPPLAAKGLLGRVRGVSALPARRRPALHRLEDRGALRSLGRAPVRGGDESPRQHRARRQPVDGVERRSRCASAATVATRRAVDQARVRRAADRRARAPAPAPARRRRARPLRRSHSKRRSRRAPATASGGVSSPRSRSRARARRRARPRRCIRPRA